MRSLENTAYHEAGHAYAYLLTGRKFKDVTIVREEDSLGHVAIRPPSGLQEMFEYPDSIMIGPKRLAKRLPKDLCSIAGPVAEKIHCGRNNYSGARYEKRNIIDWSLYDAPGKITQKYFSLIQEYMQELFSDQKHWRVIILIATALLEKKTLSFQEVEQIYNRPGEIGNS